MYTQNNVTQQGLMLMLVNALLREKGRILRSIFEKIGASLNINTFENRLRIQKIVYMLQLHPEFRGKLNYDFNMFIRGPYSPELARVYYNLPEDDLLVDIKVSEDAIAYAKEIILENNASLELAATLIEVKKINKDISEKELIEKVRILKPYYHPEFINEVLEKVKQLKSKYNIAF